MRLHKYLAATATTSVLATSMLFAAPAFAEPSTSAAPSSTTSSTTASASTSASASAPATADYAAVKQKVDEVMSKAGNPEQVNIAYPGRATTVFKQIKACDGKKAEDCTVSGDNTVKQGQFYENDQEKVAAVAYELALTKAEALSKAPGQTTSGAGAFLRREGNNDIVYKPKDGMNPREQVSEALKSALENRLASRAGADKHLNSLDDAWGSLDLVRYSSVLYPVTFSPVGKDNSDDKEAKTNSYLQQAATIVFSKGKVEKYSQLTTDASSESTSAPSTSGSQTPAPASSSAQAPSSTPAATPVEEVPTDGTPQQSNDSQKYSYMGTPLASGQTVWTVPSIVTGDMWALRQDPYTGAAKVGEVHKGDKLVRIGTKDANNKLGWLPTEEAGNIGLRINVSDPYCYERNDGVGTSRKWSEWWRVLKPGTNDIVYVAAPAIMTSEMQKKLSEKDASGTLAKC